MLVNPFSNRGSTAKRWCGIGLLLTGIYLVVPILFTNWANWWACFLALPSIFLICLGGGLADHSRRFTLGARAILAAGLLLLTITLMFALRISWAVFWPIMLVVPMLGLVSLTVPFSQKYPAALFQQWFFWAGLAGLALGIEFLLMRLDVLPLYQLPFRWWSLNILLVAAGGLWMTIRLGLSGQPHTLVCSNLCLTICVAVSAAISFYHLSWDLMFPAYLLCIGFLMVTSSFVCKEKPSAPIKE